MFAITAAAIAAIFNFVPVDVWYGVFIVGTICSLLTGNGLFFVVKLAGSIAVLYLVLLFADLVFSETIGNIVFFLILILLIWGFRK